MTLPFTTEQFLQVFQTYNESVWPAQVVLFLLGLAAIYLALKSRPASARLISITLAFFWLWMGVVYHLVFFTTINKAAYGFGILYIIQGIVFFYIGVIKSKLSFRYQPDIFGVTGAVFLFYGMIIYPVLGYFLGHIYPQSPTFGLPCPTTIFTFGLMMWTDRKVSVLVILIPFLWSLLGSSAAFSLGIREDIGLLVAGLLGTSMFYYRSRFRFQKQTGDSTGSE